MKPLLNPQHCARWLGRKAKTYWIWPLPSTCLMGTEDTGNADFPLSRLWHILHSHMLDLAFLCIPHSRPPRPTFPGHCCQPPTAVILQPHQDLQSILFTILGLSGVFTPPTQFTFHGSSLTITVLKCHSHSLKFLFLHHLSLVKPCWNPAPLPSFTCSVAPGCGCREYLHSTDNSHFTLMTPNLRGLSELLATFLHCQDLIQFSASKDHHFTCPLLHHFTSFYFTR